MKVLFLDINGVMNSREFYRRRGRSKMSGVASQLDPVAVARLNRLLDATDAEIVITSTWRRLLDKVQEAFHTHGIKKDIMAATPDFFSRRDLDGCRRGTEIQSLLDQYGSIVTTFAIVDDGDDMGSLVSYLVKTDYKVGLTDENVDALIRLLNANEPV